MPRIAEIWKPVRGFTGYYEVSNRGRVRALARTVRCRNGQIRHYKAKLLTPVRHSPSRSTVVLCKDSFYRPYNVADLVAKAFRT